MIIAVKDEDRVVVASIVADYAEQMVDDDYNNEDNRIIRICNDTIYCFAMAGRYVDLLLCDDKLFEFEVTPDSIIKNIIPYMYEVIKREKGLENEQWGNPSWGNTLTIIKGDRIYDITPTFYFREEKEFVCHGWDTVCVFGSLENTRGEAAEERIKKAISVFGNLKRLKMYPFIVANSKDLEIQIWEE